MSQVREDGVHGGGGAGCRPEVAQDVLQVRRLRETTGQVGHGAAIDGYIHTVELVPTTRPC